MAWWVKPKLVLRAGYGIYFTPENSARSELLTENYPFYSQQFISNNIGVPPAYLLDSGVLRPTSISVAPGAASAPLPASASQTAYYVDPNSRTRYSQMFNFTLERKLAQGLTVEAGYAGALAHKLSASKSRI